jgi:hypothetical protein
MHARGRLVCDKVKWAKGTGRRVMVQCTQTVGQPRCVELQYEGCCVHHLELEALGVAYYSTLGVGLVPFC